MARLMWWMLNWLERLGACITVYGRAKPGEKSSPYLTRFFIGPKWPNGRRVYVHIFWRPDEDRDPHNHPFGYWTMPLSDGYVEKVFDEDNHCFEDRIVRQWRWAHRKASHAHRIMSTVHGHWPLVTLVYRERTTHFWGFFMYPPNPSIHGEHRVWVDKDRYFDWRGDGTSGNHDDICGE